MTGNVYKYIPSYGVGTLEMFNRVMLEFYRHLQFFKLHRMHLLIET